MGAGDDFSPSPPSRPPLPGPNDETAPLIISAVESGQEQGRGEPGQTELGTRPLKEGQDWDKSHQFQGLLALSLRPISS